MRLAAVVTTLEPPPKRLGVTHWSSRLLARELGISTATIIEPTGSSRSTTNALETAR